jgi:hypothetical protein
LAETVPKLWTSFDRAGQVLTLSTCFAFFAMVANAGPTAVFANMAPLAMLAEAGPTTYSALIASLIMFTYATSPAGLALVWAFAMGALLVNSFDSLHWVRIWRGRY